MHKNVNILILSCGRRVELVKCFQDAKKALNVQGNVVCCDANENAPALFFADKKYRVSRIDSGKYIDEIVQICEKEKISLVVPTIDTELIPLVEHKAEIESTGARVLVSNEKCVRLCRDKIACSAFLAENGFAEPKVYSEAEIDTGRYSFPLFVKPKDGSSSVNAFKVNNQKELDFFKGYVNNPIIQECLFGEEYTIDVFLDFDSNIVSCVPRKRLAVRSGEVLKGKIELNAEIIASVEKLMRLLKPIGNISVQGFLDGQGVFKYIEINPRFGGGTPMAIKAGADSCKWLYQLLLGEKLDQCTIDDGALFLRFDDCIKVPNK